MMTSKGLFSPVAACANFSPAMPAPTCRPASLAAAILAALVTVPLMAFFARALSKEVINLPANPALNASNVATGMPRLTARSLTSSKKLGSSNARRTATGSEESIFFLSSKSPTAEPNSSPNDPRPVVTAAPTRPFKIPPITLIGMIGAEEMADSATKDASAG